MRIALITGASSGLGKEFIRQLRREKLDEIWAIARRKERLLELSGLVPIPVRPISLDLTKPESIDTLERLLAEAQPHIHILINAAGFGKIGNYREISRSDTDRMIDLNCRAAVDVTLLALPYMNKGDRILGNLLDCSLPALPPSERLCRHKILSVPLQPRASGRAYGPQDQGYGGLSLLGKKHRIYPKSPGNRRKQGHPALSSGFPKGNRGTAGSVGQPPGSPGLHAGAGLLPAPDRRKIHPRRTYDGHLVSYTPALTLPKKRRSSSSSPRIF